MPDIDLDSFIGSTLEKIKSNAKDDFMVQGPIEFELSTVTEQGQGGKADIKVLSANTEAKIQNIQKIKFQIFNKNDVNLRKIAADAKLVSEENRRRWSVGYTPGPVQ